MCITLSEGWELILDEIIIYDSKFKIEERNPKSYGLDILSKATAD